MSVFPKSDNPNTAAMHCITDILYKINGENSFLLIMMNDEGVVQSGQETNYAHSSEML